MPVCASKLLLIQSVQAIAADVRDFSIKIEPLKVFFKKTQMEPSTVLVHHYSREQ